MTILYYAVGGTILGNIICVILFAVYHTYRANDIVCHFSNVKFTLDKESQDDTNS